MKFLKVHNTVLDILQTMPETRKDDWLLYLEVCRRSPLANVYALSENFETVLLKHKELNLPNYEGVTRARRKIQEKHPELKDKATAEARADMIDKYIGYARADI